MKWNKEEVINYIYGNDTNIDVEILEDNPEFMLEVLKKSKDINFYNLCSKKVKTDYKFVSGVVLTFKHQLDFIVKVANTYFENSLNNINEINELELSVIMKELLGNNFDSVNYSVLIEAKFQACRLSTELVKLKDASINNIGMGFSVILEKYGDSSIIINHFAKKMIWAIFLEYDIDLEVYLHQNFTNFKDIESRGIRTFLLDFIASFDEALKTYLNTHINLLDELKDKVLLIGKKWDTYNKKIESDKYNEVLNLFREYMEEHQFETSFDETEILYYIALELNVASDLLKYDGGLSTIYADYTEKEKLSEIKRLANVDRKYWNITDYKHYFYLKNAMQKILAKYKSKDDNKSR